MTKKKKSENATATRGKPLYEIVQERGPRIVRGADPIEDVLLDEERELAREHKRLRLEQLIEKKRREVEKMREGNVNGGSLPSNTDFLSMAKFLSDLSPEEAQRVRSAYAFFKTAEKGGGGGMSLLPMLVNYAKSNPGTSENQMINYLKLMDSQLMKGLEIAKAMNPNPSKQNSSLEFLRMVKELIIEGVRNPVLQAIKENQPTPGFLDQILTNPTLLSQARSIGLFGGHGGAGTSNIDLQIEQLRGERMMESKRIDLEARKMMLEHEAGERRTEALLGALTPLSALIASPVDKKMRQLGRSTAAQSPSPIKAPPAPTQPQAPVNAPPPPGNVVHIRCTCGHREAVSFEGEPPKSLNCPACGQELVIGGAPSEEEAPPPSPESKYQAAEEEALEWSPKIHPRPSYAKQP